MSELVFNVTADDDGGFCAAAEGQSIFTQGDTWDELCENIQDATRAFYFEGNMPSVIHVHLRRDEVLAVA